MPQGTGLGSTSQKRLVSPGNSNKAHGRDRVQNWVRRTQDPVVGGDPGDWLHRHSGGPALHGASLRFAASLTGPCSRFSWSSQPVAPTGSCLQSPGRSPPEPLLAICRNSVSWLIGKQLIRTCEQMAESGPVRAAIESQGHR